MYSGIVMLFYHKLSVSIEIIFGKGISDVFLKMYMCAYVKGLIHVGDELKEVNGIPVDDKTPEEIIRILVSCRASSVSAP